MFARQLGQLRIDGQLKIDQRVGPELGGESLDSGARSASVEQLRLQAHDEVANVANGCVDAVDRPVGTSGALGLVLGDDLGQVLERQRDPYRLWMIESCRSWLDALTFFDDRKSADLLVQPRVLHGDAGVQRKHLNKAQVDSLNLRAVRLLVRYRLPIGPALGADRRAQERRHRGWFSGKP